MVALEIEDIKAVSYTHLDVYKRQLYGGECGDFETAVRAQLAHARIVKGGRNILLTHHFVVNGSHLPEVCDSDSRLSVGGADQVNAALFKQFDYVALGHIHGRQRIGERHVWYSGSPLKYSFSEIHHKKCVLIGEMDAAGNVSLKERELTPLRDMRKIEGPLRELVRAGNALEENDPALSDYLLAVLTDEEELADPIGALRGVYPTVSYTHLRPHLPYSPKKSCASAASPSRLSLIHI